MANKKFRVRKGDRVVVIAGRDKGKSGEIVKVDRENDRVVVQGVNMAKRHTAPSRTNTGGIVEKELPIHISNVAVEDPSTKKGSRVGFRTLEDGRKVRFARASGEVIDV